MVVFGFAITVKGIDAVVNRVEIGTVSVNQINNTDALDLTVFVATVLAFYSSLFLE